MKEPKFRAWNGQRMVSPAAINEYGWYETGRDYEDGLNISFDRLMQWTGLWDKDGKEIYEGDVLQDSGKYMWEVQWHAGHACFMVLSIDNGVVHEIIDNLNMTVVGNIYQP